MQKCTDRVTTRDIIRIDCYRNCGCISDNFYRMSVEPIILDFPDRLGYFRVLKFPVLFKTTPELNSKLSLVELFSQVRSMIEQ
jgi:hypothetical protein